jgi:hypothetical protein
MINAFAVLLALAAAGSSAPDWVEGQSRKYPREMYMTGVGSGDDRASAEDRARGEIARVFSTVVTVNTRVFEAEKNKNDAKGKSETSFSNSVDQTVQTASRKVLEGTEIVETWKDQTAKRVYALAALDRHKAMASVEEKLDELDAQSKEWNGQMQASADRLGKVKAAMKLMALLKARESLNAELRILDASGHGRPNPLNEALVRPEASKALSSLEITVDVEGASSRDIETGIVKGLNSLGLSARTTRAEAPDVLVEGKIDSQELPEDGKWRFARSQVTMILKDGRSGKVFLQFDGSERQAALSQKEAQRRSLAKLSEKLAPRISEAISGYFENQ